MAMFENFPYTDMHNLNLDWIIKIAKDFLDQYTHIQQIISEGEENLNTTISDGLQSLDDKKVEIETLLNEWYDTHSSDIANQLAAALADLNDWYSIHQNYLDATLAAKTAEFNQAADTKAAQTIASIPDDYSALSLKVAKIPVRGFLFDGHLELNTYNLTLVVKIHGNNNLIQTHDQRNVETTLSNNDSFVLPNANNYLIAYNETTGNFEFITGNLTGHDLTGLIVFGHYDYGVIVNASGLILVNGVVQNRDFNSYGLEEGFLFTGHLEIDTTNRILTVRLNGTNIMLTNRQRAVQTNLVNNQTFSIPDLNNYTIVYNTSTGEFEFKSGNDYGIDFTNYLIFGQYCLGYIMNARGLILVNGEVKNHYIDRSGIDLHIKTVGTNKQYTTIQAAVSAANAGDIIIIDDGTYNERIINWDKPISLIGKSREGVIIQYPNTNYSAPPVEMAKGIIKNLTIHATKVSGTTPQGYALHCDFQGSGVIGGYLHCENVKFINDNFRSVGLGLRGNAHIEFVNCIFETLEDTETLFMHDANDLAYDIANQSVSFNECTFITNSNSKATIEVTSQEVRSQVATITCQRNIVINKGTGGQVHMNIYNSRPIIDGTGWMGSSDWVLTDDSNINTASIMNNV